MDKRLASLALPMALLVSGAAPGPGQVLRLGVELGALSIRMAPDGPPPPLTDQRTARPDANHQWIDGCWDRQEDRWAWAPGRWGEPGQPGSRWVKAQYRKNGGATRYEPGHWSHQSLAEGEDYNRWHKGHRR